MKILQVLFLLMAVAVLTAGCGKKSEELSGTMPGPDAPIAEKIEAASKLPSADDRDMMLRRLAMEAVQQGQADMAMKAIEKLETPQARDNVTAGIAKLLARMGDPATAAQFAEKISSPDLKKVTIESISGQ